MSDTRGERLVEIVIDVVKLRDSTQYEIMRELENAGLDLKSPIEYTQLPQGGMRYRQYRERGEVNEQGSN